jgi:hypothetical protein
MKNRRSSVSVPPTSTNPIWRLAAFFGQVGRWKNNMKEVAVEYDVEAMKSSGWSMNLKRAD